MKHLVYNAVRCKACKKKLISTHTHDYKVCGCPQETMVDGGLSYERYGGLDLNMVESLHVYDDAPITTIRRLFRWGTRGKEGKTKLKFVKLKDITDDHLLALLEYNCSDWIKTIFQSEYNYRTDYGKRTLNG